MNIVEEYYNCQYDEWNRLERHRIEFEITKRVLNEYIKAGSEVLDVGGGPGRYSIWLAQQGHKVTLYDLSEMLVKQAAENAQNAGVTLQAVMKGNVLELDRMISDKTFDAVLCMGPMYHLLEDEERREAARQCLARLKPGGILIVAFISAYAPVVDCLKKDPTRIREQKEYFLEYLQNGRNRKEFGFTDAYFIHPDRIEELFAGLDVETIRIMAAEGLGSPHEERIMNLEENDFLDWIDLFYAIADHKAVLGSCEHFLYAGRKL